MLPLAKDNHIPLRKPHPKTRVATKLSTSKEKRSICPVVVFLQILRSTIPKRKTSPIVITLKIGNLQLSKNRISSVEGQQKRMSHVLRRN